MMFTAAMVAPRLVPQPAAAGWRPAARRCRDDITTIGTRVDFTHASFMAATSSRIWCFAAGLGLFVCATLRRICFREGPALAFSTASSVMSLATTAPQGGSVAFRAGVAVVQLDLHGFKRIACPNPNPHGPFQPRCSLVGPQNVMQTQTLPPAALWHVRRYRRCRRRSRTRPLESRSTTTYQRSEGSVSVREFSRARSAQV